MSHIRILATIVLALTLSTPAVVGAGQLPGRVLRVIDGDSLVLVVRGHQYRVELAGVDAPELNQPWGSEAADYLRRRLTGRFVVVSGNTRDARGQVSGTLALGNEDVAMTLLREGLAWCTVGDAHASQYPVQQDRDDPYRTAEQIARTEKRGLWSDPDPIPPWTWRTQRGPAGFNPPGGPR